MYLQKVISKKTFFKNKFFVGVLKLMTKIASVPKRHGSAALLLTIRCRNQPVTPGRTIQKQLQTSETNPRQLPTSRTRHSQLPAN
jgi:hypothetical protein